MERLIEIVNGIPTYNGKECHYDIGLTAGEMTSSAAREVMTRLAAYEDTGLEPEEIQEAVDLFPWEDADIPVELKKWVERGTWHVRRCNEYSKKLQAYRASGLTPDKLPRAAELVKADEEGLCAVLPCEVGTTVYYPFCGRILEKTVTAYRRMFDARTGVPDIEWWYELNGDQGETMDEDLIGKTIFLTRAEAEAALADK
ncbi:hypothetical protein LI291_10590 [Intestinibacillus massiliensis]|nr:hypothetical protein [Intestinibacillus massiliensis]